MIHLKKAETGWMRQEKRPLDRSYKQEKKDGI